VTENDASTPQKNKVASKPIKLASTVLVERLPGILKNAVAKTPNVER